MLFNSYPFVFAFLPLTLIGFFLLLRLHHRMALHWLVLASIFFYGWWNPKYLLLIIASMAANFLLGEVLSRAKISGRNRKGRLVLILGVALNLCLLAYYKYAGFLVANVDAVIGAHLSVGTIILPLGISFFTFQQIAYLVDAYKGITKEYSFSHYALFVTFFPQLIAGPIVHHREMLPQFMNIQLLRPRAENITVGLAIFAIGLCKKTIFADSIAHFATPVFNAAHAGSSLSFFEAWGGALAYTAQLYFDFSGYSDMAIGGARLFGIRLPLNFHSPYKATNIIEFWRRWHMTLSRFLRDYLYIPLGGNRKGKARRYNNLLLTMLIGGLWHGAGWTFVMWGGLHGVYLIINHAWRRVHTTLLPQGLLPRPVGKALAWTVTFLAVVVGWVFFRAADFSAAAAMLRGMAGLEGVKIPNAIAARLGALWPHLNSLGIGVFLGGGSQFLYTWLWLALLLPIALIMPNTQQIMEHFDPAVDTRASSDADELRPSRALLGIRWRPNIPWAVVCGTAAALGVLAMTSISEFLYFQF